MIHAKTIIHLGVGELWFRGSVNIHLLSDKLLIGHFGKNHNSVCLSSQILHKHRETGRETGNNAYAKFWGDKQRVL